MNKLFLLISGILLSSSVMLAQDDCMAFFPKEEGAMLVNKTYDAQNNLLRTTTYRVNHNYDYISGADMQIGFVVTDNNGAAIDDGNIDARCDDGTFSMRMINRGMTQDVMDALSGGTELVGNFLDYPNIFNDEYPFEKPFQMTNGDFTIQSKNDKKEWIRVRVHNRQYTGNEKITVPAKAEPFNAAKTTFDFEVIKEGNTMRYRGVEWYAENASIVRSETYDSNNNLVNYTVLTTFTNK